MEKNMEVNVEIYVLKSQAISIPSFNVLGVRWSAVYLIPIEILQIIIAVRACSGMNEWITCHIVFDANSDSNIYCTIQIYPLRSIDKFMHRWHTLLYSHFAFSFDCIAIYYCIEHRVKSTYIYIYEQAMWSINDLFNLLLACTMHMQASNRDDWTIFIRHALASSKTGSVFDKCTAWYTIHRNKTIG